MSFRSKIARAFIVGVVGSVFIWFFGPVTASDDPLVYVVALFIVALLTSVIFDFIRTRVKWIGMFGMRFIRYVIALYKAERERFEDKLQGKREYKARRKRVAQDQLFDECEGVCAGCKDRFGLFRPMQIDHIIPVHQGGTNDLKNLQLLCESCASKKRAKDRLFGECGGICPGCRRRFGRSHLQIDHIIPVRQGGTDDLKNLQLLCKYCALVKDQLFDQLFDECRGVCIGCKDTFRQIGNVQIHHLMPVDLGGTDDLKNLQLLCESCIQVIKQVFDDCRDVCASCFGPMQEIMQSEYIIPLHQGGTIDPKNMRVLCESCISKKEATPNERQPIPKWVKPELFRECGGVCAGCMDTFRQIGNLQIDHIIPVHQGGTNEFENLQLLCSSCNSKKGTRTMRELIYQLRREGIRT